MYTQAQPPTSTLGAGRRASERVEFSERAVHARNRKGGVFAIDTVRALLAVRRHVAVG